MNYNNSVNEILEKVLYIQNNFRFENPENINCISLK